MSLPEDTDRNPTDGPVVLVLQHTEVCPPGRVGAWLTSAGCRLDVRRCHVGQPVPGSLDGYAGLVVLGGEMGAYDDHLHPWLTPTKLLLARAAAEKVPTLAICLGLQLLAVATGGAVAPAKAGPQLGVRAVEPTAAAAQDPVLSPATGGSARAVHWNNDLVVEVPPGATVLATSAGTTSALRLGPGAWGVQFHPEVDVATLRLWAQADVAAGLLDAGVAERRLSEVAAAEDEMVGTWQRSTVAFAALVTTRSGVSTGPVRG